MDETTTGHVRGKKELLWPSSLRQKRRLLKKTGLQVRKLEATNDHAPVFSQTRYEVTVSEFAPVNTPVVMVQATDPDTGRNAEIVYDIQRGNNKLRESCTGKRGPKEDMTTLQRQLSQLQQQLKTTKQNRNSKEQQLETAKQNLNSKEQQLETAKQNLSSKEQQLETAKQNLNSKEQQLETAKQNLNSKEQQLQQVKTENKSLQTALRREKKAPKISINLSRSLEQENSRLKDQAVTDKRKYKRLKEQSEADRREIKRLKRQISASLSISYEMTCDPRGVAVIINNIRFEDMADREGAEGDTDRLGTVKNELKWKTVEEGPTIPLVERDGSGYVLTSDVASLLRDVDSGESIDALAMLELN
ncbi:hypothetical protein Bbelb_110220 [Branchiostoma belcheri]|nr:hypothetical protein Bbelb_110220 [Branchiostoma belcheri]